MAITFVGKGTYMAGETSVTAYIPSGIQAGDLLLLTIEEYLGPLFSTVSGWSRIAIISGDTAWANTQVCYKIATGAETNFSVPITGTGGRTLITAWRGVDTLRPIDGYTTSTGVGSGFSAANPPSTVANCMLVNCIGFRDADANDTDNFSVWANTSLTSITEGHDEGDGTMSGGGIAFAYGIKPAVGVTNATTANADSTANRPAAVNVLLTPIQPATSKFFPFFM